MFNYSVEYLLCFGAMTINVKYFKCKAWTKYGAWKKFLIAEGDNSNHYADRSYLHSFWRMRNDIRRVK